MKYSTKSRLTVPASGSPNAAIGAANSRRLASFVLLGYVYVGLKALDWTSRASLLLASISVVRVGAVQYCFVQLKTVWLKMWLFPKYASERLSSGYHGAVIPYDVTHVI